MVKFEIKIKNSFDAAPMLQTCFERQNTVKKTHKCREGVSGVPLNIEFTTFLVLLLLRVLRIVILARYGCQQIFFSLTGCRKPKKVENTGLDSRHTSPQGPKKFTNFVYFKN